jgi:hypothetical protein
VAVSPCAYTLGNASKRGDGFASRAARHEAGDLNKKEPASL